ncbi:MAG: hypothetical protein R3263_05050 [Myxococcota bacterium]|nr:hypothetical protein [Myxococcota bacterium]
MRTRAEGRAGLARDALVGAAAASLLVLGRFEVLAAFAVLAVLAIPVGSWLGLVHARERWLLGVFVAAVGVRTLVALVAEFGASMGFFASDDYRYEVVGWELARYWMGESSAPPEIFGPKGYYRWNALLFVLVGRVPLAPALGNAAVGGAIAVLAWQVARRLTDASGARAAAWLTALWPSLVLWSSLNLKDALAILALLLLLHGAQHCMERIGLRGVALALAGVLLLGELRGYLVGLSVGSLALAFLLARLRASPLMMGAALVALVVPLALLSPVQTLPIDESFETLDAARAQLAVGRAAYASGADVSTPLGALRYLPLGLTYFLLAPAPWQLLGPRQLLTLPEMLAWYALLPFVVSGLVGALRERFVQALPVATLAFGLTVSYALVEGNLGTAYRHRAQVLVLFLIFAGAGLARRRAARRAAACRMPPGAEPGALAVGTGGAAA